MNLTRYYLPCLVLASAVVLGQKTARPDSAPRYVNETLSFRYTVPSGMVDKTRRFRDQIAESTRLSGNPRTLGALLAMSSGPESNSADWGSVTIETYPRNLVSEPDDRKAEAQMNMWVAQSSERSTYAHEALISGQSFLISIFGLREGRVKKGAVVWTTVRKGQLLSFAFAANSPEELQTLAESMKTVQFF